MNNRDKGKSIFCSAILGFYVFNWPFGKIFLGDAGAYALGHIMAWLGIVLSARHPELSPLALILILFWPVADTVFTMARRVIYKRAIGQPDRFHFHHIVVRIVARLAKGRLSQTLVNSLSALIMYPIMLAPDQDGVVLDEQSAQMPLNAYGASKRAVEEILRDFGVSHGLEAVVFRYFNVAGADVEAEVGEWHQPETHLIPVMIEAAAGKRDALTIYGTDYPTSDGTCVRDYVHVMDLVDAHIKGLECLLDGKGSRVFNLGTGTGFSVKEVIAEFKAATGNDVRH